ncbi:putative outer membrane lipoprotein [Flavobacterium psychrophilum]|uniref:translocation and assembly module lipoprotein TamL n=1 Tax=Flavobacterium psychrophilum TaxID=96345 RepID=UPI000B7C39B1|nr:BamA/TamA family outer membrane protein [Flavobacterium psychrophilum]ELI6454484.1 BamA/TamA family outer membrane protein [Flavobacterium psychrophilum]ELI6456148.1 BamA/TamA family outer membrane protein [Flavobacterium psychrophilum]MCB6097494.1 BamA/TamA family outer membrane protein [Flavobacterium psychrophilum]MCB6230189.1 BamA/TamA family outer membrane protein [Flavobacterium psychrophilum]SNB30660.1 putative outer membrane lipoprotein [Flavobacterium psychrophilum]
MGNITTKISLFILIIALITACNVVKKVPAGKHLLLKNEILVNGEKNSQENIISQLAQQTNTSIFGYKLRLNMFNLAKNNTDSIFRAKYIANPAKYKQQAKWLSKKQVDRLGQSFWYSGWHSFLRRTGEPPIIIDTLKAKKSAKRLKDYYFNQGFFDANVKFLVTYQEKKRGNIQYTVTTGDATFLDTISHEIETPALDSLYLLSKSKSYIKKGQQYKAANFSNERSRITNYFRNHGVYYFQQQSIHFVVDTLNPNKKAPVKINITDQVTKTEDSIRSKPYKIYHISQVNLFVDNTTAKNKSKNDSTTYKNFNLYSPNKLRYRAKAITDAVFIQKDSLYNDDKRSLTLRSLSNLKVFNYPNVQYIEDTISKSLQANIYLTSKPKFHFNANADFTRSNIQIFGITGGSGVSIRNIFRGAETLEIGLHGNIGSSRDVAITGNKFFNISEVGADIRLNFPRIFLPFKTNRIIPKTMLPSSIISAGYAKQTNIGLDKENFTAAINYNWIPKKNTIAKFDLVNIQYVKNINIDNYFNVYRSTYNKLNGLAKTYNNNNNDLSKENGGVNNFIDDVLNHKYALLTTQTADYKLIKSIKERKDRLTENNLIFAANFSYSKDSKTDIFDKEFYSFRGKLESAGNILSLASSLAKQTKKEDGTRNVFGLQYSQYIKGEFDYAKNWDLTNGKSFAVRSFFGIAIPYGNSKSVPFARSYFAGGSNDNRAWQSYSLGPGNSGGLNDFNEANMKIALNAEFRYKLFGNLNGAVFADCGNIWNVFDSETDETKVFSGISSLKSLALGTGLGLRYDFKFFVFRLDFGFKTYNPAKLETERWFKELNLSKTVVNFGINYPF